MPNPTHIPPIMLASCGINCGVCRAHLRQKNKCLGCNGPDTNKSKHCVNCYIKNCTEPKASQSIYCFACEKYPCARMKQLDKRYRTKYGMSPVENLNNIQTIGIDGFMEAENLRWVCEKCGDVVCVHDKRCYGCGEQF